jgi:hypothetical protein
MKEKMKEKKQQKMYLGASKHFPDRYSKPCYLFQVQILAHDPMIVLPWSNDVYCPWDLCTRHQYLVMENVLVIIVCQGHQ